jgi:VWFA-related protein
MNIRADTFRSVGFIFIFSLFVFFTTGVPSGNAAAGQENATTFRVSVDLVQVPVVVMDSKGKPIIGLKRDDFRIFQDDKEQQISAFDVVGEESDKTPPAAAPDDLEESSRRGKVVVLLFDQNTINSAHASNVLESADKYVRQHMHPNDLMAVAVYVQSLKITAPLTHDSAKVIEAIRQANAAGTGAPAVQGTTGAKELRSKVVDVFRSLKSLCIALESVRGRKTILMFTEDMSVPTDVLTEFNSLVAAARKADVSFFTMDARGQSESSTNTASMLDAEIQARPAPRTNTVNLAQFADQTTSTIFRSLASQSYGYPVFNTDNLAEALERVDLELGHYYILGFQSSSARSDGKPHKIEVKLNAKDARLKYRDTYTDPHPIDPLAGSKSESPLRTALTASAPITQLPVSFRAVYFYESPQVAQIPVFVKIRRGSIALKQKEAQWIGSVSIMGVAAAADGSTASRFSGEINIAVNRSQAEAFRNQDLVYKNFLRLKPGQYHVKLAVMDEKGKIGTAERDLMIPVFTPGSLTASSLIISQEMIPLPGLIKELKPQMMSQMDPMQYKGFQIYAPVEVEIDHQQRFVVFYRIYSTSAGLPKSLMAKVQASDEKGEIHTFPPVDLASSALPVSQTETAIGFILPGGNLKPGKYRLTVETVGSEGGKSVVSEAEFLLR